jgi:hypothetical protein
LVCFFVNCNLVYWKFRCLKSKEPQVFFYVCVYYNLWKTKCVFYFIFGCYLEVCGKKIVCVYVSSESKALLFQVIYQS